MLLLFNHAGSPRPAIKIAVFIVVCFMCVSISVSSAAAQTISNTTGETCHIRGKVLDSYGTCVPGAEVRLMMPDGRWYETPDNPVLSGSRDSAMAGAFEFTAMSDKYYVLNALKDHHNGSIMLCPLEGDNYVEITIPGYTYVRPVQNIPSSGASLSDPVVEPQGPQKTVAEPAGAAMERATLDLMRLGLAGIVVLAGLLLSIAVLRWRR